MRKAGAKDYKLYSKKILKICKKKPVSLEVFGDNYYQMMRQAIKINDWANEDEIKKATNISLRINDILSGLFRAVGIKLVDFKLEFGRYWNNEEKKIILVDEISPDTCRLWDTKNEKKVT